MEETPGTCIKVLTVFIVAHDARHRGELQAALSKFFEVSVFPESGSAMAALETADPDVIIAENSIPPRGSISQLVAQASDEHHKAGFLLTRLQDENFAVSLEKTGRPVRYLSWPFTATSLKTAIHDLINEKAEKAWDELPETQRKTLKLMVEEYQDIADKIAAGEPIQYNTAAESCTPLVSAINEGGHNALLKSVQSHHNYTYVHFKRVATLLTMFGFGIGMRGDDLLILSTGGLLHDLCKMVTPPNILDKPDKLDENEWPIMQNHVVESGNLLAGGDDMTKGAKIIAEQHH